MRRERQQLRRVSGKQVSDFLVSIKKAKVKKVKGVVDEAANKAALRATQRYPMRAGFGRGVRTGHVDIHDEYIAWCNNHLRKIL